jgi:hypothetical protein
MNDEPTRSLAEPFQWLAEAVREIVRALGADEPNIARIAARDLLRRIEDGKPSSGQDAAPTATEEGDAAVTVLNVDELRTMALYMLGKAKTKPDAEEAHRSADAVLCVLLTDLGFGDVVAAWHTVGKGSP